MDLTPFLKMAAQMLVMQAVILLILRPVILWYLGISRLLNSLEGINESLKCMPAVQEMERRRRAGAKKTA